MVNIKCGHLDDGDDVAGDVDGDDDDDVDQIERGVRRDVIKIADTEIPSLLCPWVMNTTDDHTDKNHHPKTGGQL